MRSSSGGCEGVWGLAGLSKAWPKQALHRVWRNEAGASQRHVRGNARASSGFHQRHSFGRLVPFATLFQKPAQLWSNACRPK